MLIIDVACDESQLTGESMPVKKSAENPFMLSGCKVYFLLIYIFFSFHSKFPFHFRLLMDHAQWC